MTSSEFDVLAQQMEQTGRQIGDILEVLETIVEILNTLTDKGSMQREDLNTLTAQVLGLK